MLCFYPKQSCAKEWAKKKRNSLSSWVFWCKKQPSKKSKNQQSNIPSDLRKVCCFLTINRKCSLVEAVKATSKKQRERTGFKWVVAAVMKSRQTFYQKQQSNMYLLPCKRLGSGLQPVIKTKQKEDRKNKKERTKKEEYVSTWFFSRCGTHIPSHGGFFNATWDFFGQIVCMIGLWGRLHAIQ